MVQVDISTQLRSDPKATATATASVDDTKGPTLAEIIKSQESLRKDQARALAKFRVELSKPKASDIEAILQLYADGEHPDWSVLSAKLEAARPFQIRKATFPMVLETGQSLTRTPNGKILTSLMRDHGNPGQGIYESYAYMGTRRPTIFLLPAFDGKFQKEIQVKVVEEFGVDIRPFTNNERLREGESEYHKSGKQCAVVASGG
ncbi:hypothetical protein ABG067_005695 [Albugo candida]